MSRYIGDVSAYAYAVSKGYTGTEEEFAELMADYAEVGQRAEDAAESALNSKTAAQTAATTATNKASEATTAAQTATTKAGEAQTSAQTASTKASEAVGCVEIATQKATEATQSASQALGYKNDAESAKTASQTAQGLAESARDSAIQAKNDAESARDEAQTIVDEISAKSTQIDANTENIASLTKDKAPVITDTASGAIASFTDGADGLPLKSLVVDINPVQDLSNGDPSPENICPISGWTQVTVNHSDADMTNPTTLTIQLGQTVYGGTLDVLSGELVIDRAMVDLGTLSWALDGLRFKARIDNMANKAGRTIKMACSCFKALTNGEPYDASVDLVCYGAYSYIYVHDFAYTDIATFKTAVTGQQLAYELSTPITLTLSPTEIKSLLADNNIWADSGDCTAEYRADTKLYIAKKIAEAMASLT